MLRCINARLIEDDNTCNGQGKMQVITPALAWERDWEEASGKKNASPERSILKIISMEV